MVDNVTAHKYPDFYSLDEIGVLKGEFYGRLLWFGLLRIKGFHSGKTQEVMSYETFSQKCRNRYRWWGY